MRIRSRVWVVCAAAWTGAFLLVGLPAAGQDATVDAVEAADEAEGEAPEGGDLEAYWGHRLARASQRVETARQKVAEAEAAYSRARHDGQPRGDAFEEIKERYFASERELRDARAALPRLVEQARRAGVPPGVIRQYWDEDEPDREEPS